MENVATIEILPEELLLNIFTLLDSPPPSELHIREEPSLGLTSSELCNLKHTSLVSRRWRRIVLQLLFKHARFRLDTTPRSHWRRCPVCGTEALRQASLPAIPPASVHVYHDRMIKEAYALHTDLEVHSDNSNTHNVLDARLETTLSASSQLLLPIFYHALRDFLSFIEASDLRTTVESFVLLSNRMLAAKTERFPHRAATHLDWRYRGITAFWQHLLSIINPVRVAIVAPPIDLACLSNCAIDTFGDWAFGDMEYHVLDLQRDASSNKQLCPPVLYEALDFAPQAYPGVAGGSILNLRSWTHVGLNEGSFLKAYGTYEYFERGPPSLIYSIKDSLASKSLSSVRSLTYTAIFPFANHLNFEHFLPQLEYLDIQVAPNPQSGILDDRKRTGKAELEDCWAELMGVYSDLAAHLATFRISALSCGKLTTFVCRDCRIPALQEELDEVFTPLSLPVWAEYEPGVFRRLAIAANAEGMNEVWQAH